MQIIFQNLKSFFRANVLLLSSSFFILSSNHLRLEAQVTEEIKQALERGEIPGEIAEDFRLVPRESQQSKEFQISMERLFKRLFPDHDLSKERKSSFGSKKALSRVLKKVDYL